MATNADRRLSRLKSDPNYSAKLSKLTKAQQRSVETLVRENKGREARSRINELDEARRVKVRTRSKARRVRTKRELVTDKLLHLHGSKANVKTIRRGVSAMSDEEMNRILKLNESELNGYVMDKVRIPPPPGKINPFWYR